MPLSARIAVPGRKYAVQEGPLCFPETQDTKGAEWLL